MAAKYKMGTLIEFTNPGGTNFGIVTGVVTRKVGFSYEVNGSNGSVDESDVVNGYRPITQRKVTRTKTTKTTSAKKVKTTSQENSLAS